MKNVSFYMAVDVCSEKGEKNKRKEVRSLKQNGGCLKKTKLYCMLQSAPAKKCKIQKRKKSFLYCLYLFLASDNLHFVLVRGPPSFCLCLVLPLAMGSLWQRSQSVRKCFQR